jgi:hypothetical protein
MRHAGDKNRRLMFFMLFSFAVFLLAACATLQQKGYHGLLMRGNIIETSDSGVYLCIGKKDGASVGQELHVYKVTYTGQPKALSFKREKTGKAKIVEIIDEHFAIAVVVSGTAVKNNIVELES